MWKRLVKQREQSKKNLLLNINSNQNAINLNLKQKHKLLINNKKINNILVSKSIKKANTININNKIKSPKTSTNTLNSVNGYNLEDKNFTNITEYNTNLNNKKELVYTNEIHSFKLNKINKTLEFVPKIKEKNLSDVLNSKLNSQKIKSPEEKINYFKDEIKINIESFGSTEKDSFKQKSINITFNISNLFKLLNDLHNECKLYLYRNTFSKIWFNLGNVKNQFLIQILYYNLFAYDNVACIYEVITNDYAYKFIRNKFSFSNVGNNLNNSKVINKYMFDNIPYFIPINNGKTCNSLWKTNNAKFRKLDNKDKLNSSSIENFFFKLIFKPDEAYNVLLNSSIKLKKLNYFQVISLEERYYIENKDLETLETIEFIVDKEWCEADFELSKIEENSIALSKYIIGEYLFAKDYLVADIRKLKNLGFHVCIEVNSESIREDDRGYFILNKNIKQLFSLFLNKVFMYIIRGYNEKNLEDSNNIKLDLRISFYKFIKIEKNNKLNSKIVSSIVNINKQIFLYARHCFKEITPREKTALCLMRIRKKLAKKLNNKEYENKLISETNTTDIINNENNNFNNKLYNKGFSLLHKNIILKVSEFIDYVKIVEVNNIFKNISK